MPSFSSDARFFGLDLRDFARQIVDPWAHASHWRVFSWLSPSVSVRVLHADGREVMWVGAEGGGTSPAPQRKADSAQFCALEVPEAMVLRRRVRLPSMSVNDQESALALEARATSPFAVSDLVWGAAPAAALDGTHSLVIASRAHLVNYRQSVEKRLAGAVAPEMWSFCDERQPIVLQGFGESQRLAFIARWRRAAVALLLSALALLVCIALSPSVQTKLRANQAHAAYTLLAQSAEPVLKKRELLVKSGDQLAALQARLLDRIEPLRLLETLTRVLPDDTVLQSLKLNGNKVTLAGLTANSSSLMQVLGSEAGMRDVRAPSPATRMAGTGKESFVIEFSADPAQFGVVGAVKAGAPAAAVKAPGATRLVNEASASQQNPQAPAAPPAAMPAPLQARGGAAASSGASFGGGATFGGTVPKATRAPSSAQPGKGNPP